MFVNSYSYDVSVSMISTAIVVKCFIISNIFNPRPHFTRVNSKEGITYFKNFGILYYFISFSRTILGSKLVAYLLEISSQNG